MKRKRRPPATTPYQTTRRRGHKMVTRFWENIAPRCTWGFWVFGTISAGLFLGTLLWSLPPQIAALTRLATQATAAYAACCLVLMVISRRKINAR